MSLRQANDDPASTAAALLYQATTLQHLGTKPFQYLAEHCGTCRANSTLI